MDLRESLGRRAGDLYRIRLSFAGEDARVRLRGKARLSSAERAKLVQRLDGMDARSRSGPWTREVLRRIAAAPGKRAADLAAGLGEETRPFKARVRRLKELGLTESLEVGYRLSPRGRTVLKHLGG